MSPTAAIFNLRYCCAAAQDSARDSKRLRAPRQADRGRRPKARSLKKHELAGLEECNCLFMGLTQIECAVQPKHLGVTFVAPSLALKGYERSTKVLKFFVVYFLLASCGIIAIWSFSGTTMRFFCFASLFNIYDFF